MSEKDTHNSECPCPADCPHDRCRRFCHIPTQVPDGGENDLIRDINRFVRDVTAIPPPPKSYVRRWALSLIEREVAAAVRQREETLVAEIRELRPILYNEDSIKHARNVERYNTIDEVLALINPPLQ